jgi:hypothetical protein
MPVELHQLPLMPQAHDEPQPRLEQTQGRVAHVINELLLAAGDDIRPPQHQPSVDQCQGQLPQRYWRAGKETSPAWGRWNPTHF